MENTAANHLAANPTDAAANTAENAEQAEVRPSSLSADASKQEAVAKDGSSMSTTGDTVVPANPVSDEQSSSLPRTTEMRSPPARHREERGGSYHHMGPSGRQFGTSSDKDEQARLQYLADSLDSGALELCNLRQMTATDDEARRVCKMAGIRFSTPSRGMYNDPPPPVQQVPWIEPSDVRFKNIFTSMAANNGLNPHGREALAKALACYRVLFSPSTQPVVFDDGQPLSAAEFAVRVVRGDYVATDWLLCLLREIKESARPDVLLFLFSQVSTFSTPITHLRCY